MISNGLSDKRTVPETLHRKPGCFRRKKPGFFDRGVKSKRFHFYFATGGLAPPGGKKPPILLWMATLIHEFTVHC